MKTSKFAMYFMCICLAFFMAMPGSSADSLVKKEPPSPNLTNWKGIRQERGTFLETLKKWGISVEVEDIQEMEVESMPSLVNVKSSLTGPNEFTLSAELGMKKSASALAFSGTFKTSPDTTKIDGDVTVSLKGTGVTTKGKWSSEKGLELEGGVVWDRALYTIGATVTSEGEGNVEVGFKLGPAKIKLDPAKYYQRAVKFAPVVADRVNEEIGDVGGVMIQFDLGMLAMAITDSPPVGVEKLGDVSLVSLKRVLEARQKGEMENLGEVTSIHGFMLDNRNGDVILIGKSEPWAPKIGVDVLIAALRSVWRDGLTPWVSIDPDPSDDAAPHHARYGGISSGLEDSSLLKIMFEADYTYKKYDLDEPGMAIPGTKSYFALFREDAKSSNPQFANADEGVEDVMSRDWLSPLQPGIGDIWHLETKEGALYVFRSGVLALTEIENIVRVRQLTQYDDDLEVGKADPLGQIACLEFTYNFDKLERRFPEFKQIHQVFELVMFAKLLRMKRIESDMLTELSLLPVASNPHRKRFSLIGPKEVSDNWELSGGAVAKVRLSRAKLHMVRELDSIFERLRAIEWQRPIASVKNVFMPMMRQTAVLGGVLLSEDLIDKGFNKLSEGNLQEALSLASRAIDIDPDAGEAYSLRGFALHELEEYEEAIEDWDKAISFDPQDDMAYFNRGYAEQKLGLHEEAVRDFSVVLRMDPRDAVTYYNRGSVRDDLGDYEGAIEDFNAALKIDSQDVDTYINLGVTRNKMGDHKAAIEDYTAALKIDPKAADAYFNRAGSKDDLGDYSGAIEDYTAVLKIDPKFVRAYANRAESKTSSDDYSGAIEDCTKALEIDPNYASAYYSRGNARGAKGDKDGAIEDYTAAIAIDPELADAYYNRGGTKLDLEDYAGAVEDYTAAIAIDPEKADTFYNRGNTKRALDDREGAIEDYTAALRIDPKYSDALVNRGICKWERGDNRAAIEDLTAALEITPRDVDTLNYRAQVREELEDFSGAVADYTALLEIDPEVAEVYVSRGLARAMRVEDAPSDEAALEMLRMVERDILKGLELGGEDWALREGAEEMLQEIRNVLTEP